MQVTDPAPPIDTGARARPETTTGLPRWVKIAGLIALVVGLLLAVQLIAGGDHGPGRHSGDDTPHTTVTESDDLTAP